MALACGLATRAQASEPAEPSPGSRPALPGAPLRVGTSGDYAPFSSVAADGSLAGFDVEVARAYARDRGREVEIVRFRWPELESRLLAGDFDVAMSGVTVRADRLARAPMTAAVARAEAVVLVPRGATVAGLEREGEGVKVAVNRGGHLERVARARLSRAAITAVDDNQSLPARLRSGEVEAIVTDSLEAGAFAREGLEADVAVVLARDRKAYWIAPAPGSGDLRTDLDAWLAAREVDGTLARLRARHGMAGAEEGAFTGTRRVVDLVARRLLLMPLVAEAKRASGAPVDAPGREAAVESAARAAAAAAGLDEASYLALVRAQIEAAKDVQRAVLAAAPSSPAAPAFDLGSALRPAIDAIDAALRAELARSAPLAASPETLARLLLDDAPLPGLDAAAAERVGRALAAIPAAAPAAAVGAR